MKNELNKIQEIISTIKPLHEAANNEREEKRALYHEVNKENKKILSKYLVKEATEAELEAADKKLDSISEEYETACDRYYGLDDILTKLLESVEAIENYIYGQEG